MVVTRQFNTTPEFLRVLLLHVLCYIYAIYALCRPKAAKSESLAINSQPKTKEFTFDYRSARLAKEAQQSCCKQEIDSGCNSQTSYFTFFIESLRRRVTLATCCEPMFEATSVPMTDVDGTDVDRSES